MTLLRLLKEISTPFLRYFRKEMPVYLFILVAGLLFFLVQLVTWAIPQLILFQEFTQIRGRVLDTRIVEKQTDFGLFYHPEVLIEYVVDESVWNVWTFDLQSLKSPDKLVASKIEAQSLLQSFRIGNEIGCWVRLDQPDQVVLQKAVSIWGWFFLLLSFSLIIIGAVGLSQTFHLTVSSPELTLSKNKKSMILPFMENEKGGISCIPDSRLINESPGTHLAFRLPLGNQPIFPLTGIILFTIAWNCVAWSIFLHGFWNFSFDEPPFDHLIGLLLRLLFCGIGIILVGHVIVQLHETFRLGPTLLEISDHPILPGRRYRLLLHQTGAQSFRSLIVNVVCEEITRFRQGTDTVTSRKDVFRQTLFTRIDFVTTFDLPLHEEFFLHLPWEAIHSFRQEHNEIVWKIEMCIQPAGKSVLIRECPIIVHPTLLNRLTMEEGT
ncbi:MAG: hypothetical protein ACRCUY_04230 [Thermoguttaceae bacterium]